MDTLSPERIIRLDGAHNVRDLGGYPLAGGGETVWRSVLRAANLSELTEADMTTLVEIGVRTIIDLRGPAELGAQPNPFADGVRLRYVNVPLYDAMAPIATIDGTFDMGARYVTALDRCGPRIAEVLGIIAAADQGAVLFHCTAGKDRTGVIAALLLTLCGVPRATIVADYEMTGQAEPLLTKLRTAALARGARPELVERTLASAPETMNTMLAHLDAHLGGVDAYMAQIGVSPRTRELIAQRLTGSTPARSQ